MSKPSDKNQNDQKSKEKHGLAEELLDADPNDSPAALENETRLFKAQQQAVAKELGADPSHLEGPSVKALEGEKPSGAFLYPLGIILVMVAVLGVIFLWAHKAHAEKDERKSRTDEVSQGPLIRVVQVQQQPSIRQVMLPGEVHPWQQATLYAKVSGYLKTILVDKGDKVAKGQLIGTLESPDTDQQVLAAEADLALKKQQEGRSTNLAKTGVVSDQDLENAQAALKVSEANLRRMRSLQAYEEIRAPFPGVVTARYVDIGALLPAATGSTQAAQPVVDVADLSRVRIWAYLGQDDAASVRVGDAVKVTFDPHPADVRMATVARISQALDQRTRTMLTELVLPNTDGALYGGEFVHLQLTVTARQTPIIPAEALIVRGGKLFVAVIEQNKAHLKAIEVAQDDGRTLQVSTGLSGGEMVAINAAGEIVDNGPVRIDTKSSQTGQVAPAR